MRINHRVLHGRVSVWILFVSILSFPSIGLGNVDVEMRLNNGGFVSFDHFKAELYLNNHDAPIAGTEIFGILEVLGAYFFWPDFTTDVNFAQMDVAAGATSHIFLEFDFPDIDAFLPFGPMTFWGAWFLDMESFGYDDQEFWLDNEHKWTPTPSWTQTPTPDPSPFADIPPGSFVMGSPSSEACRQYDEVEHQVILTRGFTMMKTEVTRQMWADLNSAQPDLPEDPSDVSFSPTMFHPVQRSTWFEAVLYANLLSLQQGYTRCYFKDAGLSVPVDSSNYLLGTFYCNFLSNGYRLPTEAEWEYACRAGTTSEYSCDEPNYNAGNCTSCDLGTHPTLEQYCVYCANSPYSTLPAGSKLPNPWGLHDVHGNVMEWCWDFYYSYPTTIVPDPTGPASGSTQAVRSGSWDTYVCIHRSACRWSYSPAERFSYLGFRLVRTN